MTPGLPAALAPILAMIALFAGAVALGGGTELLVVVLLGAAAVAALIARRHGHGWDVVQANAAAKVAEVFPALLILIAIGLLIATWVLSGTIPYLVYWGVRLIDPRYLLVTAFLATAVMSVFTGTSWGAAGTLGVALVGTAAALGAPVAATAGAVVSGAYLGDKMSPLSDTTNIAAIGAGSLLFEHIRHMLWTATPSFALCLLVYVLAGAGAPGGAGPGSAALVQGLAGLFELNPLVLVPPAVVLWGIARKSPPALAIAGSSLVAVALGVALQGFGVRDALVAGVAGFDADMLTARGRDGGGVLDPALLDPRILTLVERGGLFSMAPTLVLVFAALLLAGAMEAYGALELLVRRLLAGVRTVFGLVAATMTAGATMIALTSHGGVTMLVVGELFRAAYDERGLARVNLSRSLEDSVTLTEPLMPWTVSALFMATTLGVPTLAYAPWAVFCWGGPLFSLAIAALYRRTGRGIRPAPAADSREQRSSVLMPG